MAAPGPGAREQEDPGTSHQFVVDLRDQFAAEFQLDLDAGRRWTRWWVRASDQLAEGRAPHLPVAIAVADSHSEHAIREELRHQATHDSLTGLVLRHHLFELVEHVLRSHERHPSRLAALYVDLDEFRARRSRGLSPLSAGSTM